MTTFNASVRAGALIRGAVRRYLDKCQFNGKLAEYKELKGWLRSEFLIKGMDQSEMVVLQKWVEELDNDK